MDGIVRKERYQIMTTESVGQSFPRQWGSLRGLQGTLPLKYMVTTSLPFLDVESGVLRNGVCCNGCDISCKEFTGLHHQAFHQKILVLCETKCTPMMHLWNIFGNLERLKIYGT